MSPWPAARCVCRPFVPMVVRHHERDVVRPTMTAARAPLGSRAAQVRDALRDVTRVPAHRVARPEPLVTEQAIRIRRLAEHRARPRRPGAVGSPTTAGYDCGHSWQSAGGYSFLPRRSRAIGRLIAPSHASCAPFTIVKSVRDVRAGGVAEQPIRPPSRRRSRRWSSAVAVVSGRWWSRARHSPASRSWSDSRCCRSGRCDRREMGRGEHRGTRAVSGRRRRHEQRNRNEQGDDARCGAGEHRTRPGEHPPRAHRLFDGMEHGGGDATVMPMRTDRQRESVQAGRVLA